MVEAVLGAGDGGMRTNPPPVAAWELSAIFYCVLGVVFGVLQAGEVTLHLMLAVLRGFFVRKGEKVVMVKEGELWWGDERALRSSQLP